MSRVTLSPVMRQYASSKGRILLFVVIMGAALCLCGTSYGQATPPAAGAPVTHPHQSLLGLILGHVDFVFITIMVLSVIGLTLIIQGCIKNRTSVLMPDSTVNHIRELISQRQFKELIEYTETDPTFISRALNPALKRAPSFSSMKEAMETALGEQTADQFRKIEYLNIIGNLGPLLGLLGTVLGMIEAFQAMNAAGGNASPGELAGGISTALTHTFLGLFLAVPCLAAFGVLRTVVDKLTVKASLVAEELLLMIKPADAKPATAGARSPAAPQPGAPMPRKAPVPMPPAPAPAPM